MALTHWAALLVVLALYKTADASETSCPSVSIPEDIFAIRDDLLQLKERVTRENNQIRSVLEQHDALLKRKHNQVAFNALVQGTRSYAPNEVIKFPVVRINAGNRYNAATGKFTCGDSGLYFFVVTILSGSRPTWFQIVQQGVIKSNGYSGDGGKQSSTHAAIIRCIPNQEVWVRRTQFQLTYQHTVWEVHSEFSGFRFGD